MMTDIDARSIVGAALAGFYFAPTRVIRLSFLQSQPEELIARPEHLCAQIWLIRPKRIAFKLTKRDRPLVSVELENSPKGINSLWSFGDDEFLTVECKSISHLFFPVVPWST